MERKHTGNMEILGALIYAKEDQLPLLERATRKKVIIEVLKRKNVLLPSQMWRYPSTSDRPGDHHVHPRSAALQEKAYFVVLHPQGKVVNHFAFYMLYICKSNAFPFASEQEKSLWEEESAN
ncbi:hypothetical protein Patl1_33329 [Pistacia atlantica]|uniref:Uncharacterized protein n=1 Tax=Pistacia atlantica TaxID=434234 RepID=A0ACC0ZT44_9ROSI|nr:hypothetical protein Patl1_33329 [Pistacia atlantica]